MTAGRVTGVLEGANIDEAEGKRESAPEREKRERRDEREIARDRTRGRERERDGDGRTPFEQVEVSMVPSGERI